jgi:hypothetical protein
MGTEGEDGVSLSLEAANQGLDSVLTEVSLQCIRTVTP